MADLRAAGGRVSAVLIAGTMTVAFIAALAVMAPAIAPYPYDAMQIAERLQPPGPAHWFGTDEFGRDVLSRTLFGSGMSLMLGLGATLFSVLIGVPLGLTAGYLQGRTDELIMRGMDILMSFPPILLGLLILAVTPPATWKTIVAVGIVYVPPMARITRSVTLNLAHEDFIEAARARGETVSYVLFREILPNAWPPIIVEASLRMTLAVLLGAALSFLGLGAQPPSSDWGLMISEGRPYIDRAPWIVLAPGIAMCVTVIAVNLVGDGLREALDPKARGRTA